MAWWVALASAAGGYMNSKSAKDAAKAGSTSSPWKPTWGYLENIMAEADRLYGTAIGNPMPEFYGAPPAMRGGGVSGQTNEIADLLLQMAKGGSPFLQEGEDFLGDLYGGTGYNPIMEDVWGRTKSGSKLLQGATDQSTGHLENFIQQLFGSGLGQGTESGQFSGGGGIGNYNFSPAELGDYSVEPNEWLRAVLDGEWLDEGNPHVDKQIENLRREMLETYERSTVPQIDSTFARAGRYGSGAYNLAQATANEEINEAIGSETSNFLANNYQFERGNMMGGLGLLNSQEIAKMQTMGQMASANAGASASLAGSRYATDRGAEASMRDDLLQAILGMQGGELSALQLGLSDEQFRLGTAGDMAQLLSSDRMTGLGMIPGLEESRYFGLLAALQGQQPINAARASGANAANQNALNQYSYNKDKWAYEQNFPYEQLKFYADMILPVAGLGGNSTTPYKGNEPYMAALLAGMGGYTWGKGAFGGD